MSPYQYIYAPIIQIDLSYFRLHQDSFLLTIIIIIFFLSNMREKAGLNLQPLKYKEENKISLYIYI